MKTTRRTDLAAARRAVVCGAIAIVLALGATGCGAATDASPIGPGQPSASATPQPSTSADPQRMTVAATASAPVVERRTVGADDPGVIEQLGGLNDTITFDYPASLVQSAWREDETPHAQIILQGEVPDALWALLENAPLQVEVAVHHGPTLDESNAVLTAMGALVRASGPEASSSGHYDPLTGVYQFDYSAPHALDPAEFAALTGGAAIDLWYAGTEPVAEAL